MLHYRVQHLAVSIDDPQGLTGELPERLLGMFRAGDVAPTEGPECWPLHVRVHQVRYGNAQQTVLPPAWEGVIDGVHFAIQRQGSRRRIVILGRGQLDFDPAAGWAELVLDDPRDESAAWILLLRMICDGLTAGGRCFLHAACLAMPWGAGRRGVVLSAPSNTGKTTTALALADQGWRLLGDDITYVETPERGSKVWAFPRACHIRPGTLAMLPWLAELGLGKADAEGVRTLAAERLEHRGWTDAPWLEPALVVILAPPNGDATRVEPIERGAALAQLAAESLLAGPSVHGDEAGRDFVTIGQLAAKAAVCRLSVGPSPADVAAKLEEFLDRRQHRVWQRQAAALTAA